MNHIYTESHEKQFIHILEYQVWLVKQIKKF